jgi:hypothetical protein
MILQRSVPAAHQRSSLSFRTSQHYDLQPNRGPIVRHSLGICSRAYVNGAVSKPLKADSERPFFSGRAVLRPVEASADADHLALATFHRCDMLVTWTCQHIANASKLPAHSAHQRLLG